MLEHIASKKARIFLFAAAASILSISAFYFFIGASDRPTLIPFKGLSPFHSDSPSHSQPPAEQHGLNSTPSRPYPPPSPPRPIHPIDDLVDESSEAFERILTSESVDLAHAARAYRERRGRHPPPGFDRWFEFAQSNNAFIVEELFDQIYNDLSPLWGIEARTLRRQAKSFEFVISLRNGTTSHKTDHDRFWIGPWEDLISTLADYLPDFDMPINIMDEPRIIATWENINENVQKEIKSRKIVEPKKAISEFSGLADVDGEELPPFDPGWEGGMYWDHVRSACPPDNPARDAPTVTNFTGRPPLPKNFPANSYKGYVRNWTLARDPCQQPDIQGYHGTFIEPISMSTTQTLFPLFGSSKLPTNNEILIPAAVYWAENERYTGSGSHGKDWKDKKAGLVWRGIASGGRNKAENWTRFHRHRFVSMVNGTTVAHAERYADAAPNFELVSYLKYRLQATRHSNLGHWLEELSDVGFVGLECFPPSQEKDCPYDSAYFHRVPEIPIEGQYDYKYLPDVDGNSFSGRYLGFLRSTSVPIKATIYSEWHDSRLVPWQHFVPMDNSFVDIYGILDYFIGYEHQHAHDDVAEKIAYDGKRWAEQVLRKEDMQVYMYRLLLEYARMCDDNREMMGFVGDLLDGSSKIS